MSETNNNIPMRITQLQEATAYEDGMYYAVAKAGSGTKKISCGIDKTKATSIIGNVKFDDSHSYSGTGNWSTIALSNAVKLAIKLYNNTSESTFEVSALINNNWTILEYINDSDWYILDIPSNVTNKLVITYRGSESVSISCIIVEVTEKNIEVDTAKLQNDEKEIRADIESLNNQQFIESVTYPNRGFINTSGQVVSNSDFFYSDFIDVKNLNPNVYIFMHYSVATFTFYDENKTYLNEYIKRETSGNGMEERIITIPNDAKYVIVCTDPSYNNKVYNNRTKEIINEMRSNLEVTTEAYGNNGETSAPFVNVSYTYTVCPCKKAEKAGKIKTLYIKSYISGNVEIYVGAVDQLYLFVPRKSFNVYVEEGEQTIDISDMNIYIDEGEQLLMKYIARPAYTTVTGEPEGDNSFYYSSSGGMQLEVFGAAKAIIFGFGYTVDSSSIIEMNKKIAINSDNIETLTDNVSVLQANYNIVSDRQGNKYRLIVQNGALALLAMNFNHVLCVGNSYTTHPTTTDTPTDYRNNLWWGHWSMAATSKKTAWTTLLQNALRQKINTAETTPIFGRRYETSPNVYNLDNANTFTYWDGSAWQSLANNLSNFSDVDAIIFFLGANYSGNDWYTLYSAMLEKFLTWFPNAVLFCCSCSANSSAKDEAIQQAANEQLATYISMVGINGQNKLGAYVLGDDNNLHQIDNSAVANHFGDYGEYLINNRICEAMGYNNNTNLYNISITSTTGVTLSTKSTKMIENAIVSIFAEVESGTTLDSITVVDADSNSIIVTDHGVTSYGRIFTFEMPASNVTITANTQ